MRQAKNRAEVGVVSLGDIAGVHAAILDIEEALTVPPNSTPLKGDISPEAFLSLMTTFPVWLLRTRGRFQLIRNIRMYRIACAVLEDDAQVQAVIIGSRLNSAAIQEAYIAELLYSPVIYGVSGDDAVRLYSVWQRLQDHPELAKKTYWRSKSAFSRLFHVSPSRLK